VARCNKTFKYQEVWQLVEAKLGKVTAQRWQDIIHHIIQEDQKMWKLDGLTDNIVNKLVINGRDNETSSDHFDSYSEQRMHYLMVIKYSCNSSLLTMIIHLYHIIY
jgi:hypothetical protein